MRCPTAVRWLMSELINANPRTRKVEMPITHASQELSIAIDGALEVADEEVGIKFDAIIAV